MVNDFEDMESDSAIKERNRRLHYQKAVLERIEQRSKRQRVYLLLLLLPLLSIMTSLSLILVEEKSS